MDQQRHKLIREQFPEAAFKDVTFRQDETGKRGIPVRFYLFDDGWVPQIEAYRRAFRKEVNRRHELSKFTVYDLCEYFDSYMMDVLHNLEQQDTPVCEEQVAMDIIRDFGKKPESVPDKDWETVISIIVGRHYNF